MLEQIERFRSLEQAVVNLSSSPRSEKKFRKKGKLLPRERLAHLLDPGAPFIELSALAGQIHIGPLPDASGNGPM